MDIRSEDAKTLENSTAANRETARFAGTACSPAGLRSEVVRFIQRLPQGLDHHSDVKKALR